MRRNRTRSPRAAGQILEAVSGHAIEAAVQAADKSRLADDDVRLTLAKELEAARYEASLASRRYELVDPAKRLVARELEGRWNTAWSEYIDWSSDSTTSRLKLCTGPQLIER